MRKSARPDELVRTEDETVPPPDVTVPSPPQNEGGCCGGHVNPDVARELKRLADRVGGFAKLKETIDAMNVG